MRWVVALLALPARALVGPARRLRPNTQTTRFAANVLELSTRQDQTLDPHYLAANAKFEKKPLARVYGVAYFGATAAAVASEAVHPFARLVLIQYLVFSAFEYCFHRWCMHAPRGTLADRIFQRWNRLHVQHHVDTNKDMTMVEGYNWKGIRFNFLTSQLAALIGTSVSVALCAAARLRLPLWPTPVAALMVSAYHGVMWNRLHTDSHGLEDTLTWTDGLPYVKGVPTANPYARWLLTNHIGHHTVGGRGNYNIVFPGPDHLAGTFYRIKHQAADSLGAIQIADDARQVELEYAI
ncbi:hypothetical protein M885DRAFT_510731 [Pelagophyceae sp. CCMP2097]|nr:hypothetical protein M885DRAFT_510731 [Pelagophyceae sp. CCMP2097]